MDIVKCTKCKQALLPTHLGWACDNPDCSEEYGLYVGYMDGMEKLPKTLIETLGKVGYRFNDVVEHYEQQLKDKKWELNEAQGEFDVLTDRFEFLSKETETLKSKWWYRLFTLFKKGE